MGNRKIIQIIPAIGWCAVYDQGEDKKLKAPVVCWALIEEENGFRCVVGMDAIDTIGFCDEADNFLNYEQQAASMSF